MAPGSQGRAGAIVISALEFTAGLAIVLLVLSDIFRTILLPRPAHRALRLSPLLGRFVVPVWLRFAERLPSPVSRQSFRGTIAPLLLVGALTLWVGALFLGFGLMLHGVADDMDPPPSLGESIYHAADSFLTLGISRAAAHGWAQVVVTAAGMVGLANVTVVASYLLTVQTELNHREVLVLRTEVAAGRPPTGLGLLEAYARTGMTDQLAALFRDWENWSAHVLHTHRANPILCHFRSADEDGEWLAVFGAVLDAANLVRSLVSREGLETAHASAVLFAAMGSRTAEDLAELMELSPAAVELDHGQVAAELTRTRARLAAAGYRMIDDTHAAAGQFLEAARRYQGAIATLCSQLRMKTALHLDDVHATEQMQAELSGE